MKKRLLSAALALAMVLTLLPATVFAADPYVGNQENPDKAGVTVTYQAADASDGRQTGKWYWADTTTTPGTTIYHEVTVGIVNGTGNSGAWYSADNDAVTGIVNATGGLKTTSFTLLQDWGFSGVTADLTSLSVDVNDHALTLPSNITKLSSLTITNGSGTRVGSNALGSVSGITKTTKSATTAPVAGLTLNVTNANAGAINLSNGVGNTVSLHNGAIVTGITMDGSNTDAKGNTTYSAQNINTDGASQISSTIAVTGSSSNIRLANVTGGAAVTLTSTSGSVQVSGQSNVGNITVKSTATTATNAAVPSVSVTGGTVGTITHDGSDTSTGTASVTVGGATAGAISIKAGTVTINNGSIINGDITVPSGSVLVNSTTGVTLKNVILTGAASRTFRVTGSNVTAGDITSASGGNTLTVSIPKDLTNKFGDLTLTGYTGNGILGGKFKTQADDNAEAAWFAPTLRFAVKDAAGYWGYYGETELAAAIASIPSTAGTAGNIVLVGHTNANQVTLKNGSKEAVIGYSKATSFNLPAVLLGDTITSWTWSGSDLPYAPTAEFTVTGGNVTLLGQEGAPQLSASKLTNVTVSSGTDYTNAIRANLVGNVITLTGAVNSDGGYTVIPLTLTTDVKDANGDYVTANVSAVYNSNKKTIIFDVSAAPTLAGQSIVLTQDTLSMNNGKTVYTLNGSGLGVPASNLDTYRGSTAIEVTVNKAGWTQQQKDALIAKMTGTNGVFTWNSVPAVEQAINAAQLSISSNTTINNWITTAQNNIWRTGNKTGTSGFNGKGDGTLPPHNYAITDATRPTVAAKYNKVWLVPYLQVTVSDVNEATGYMTLTLTPYYRVDVSAEAAYDPANYYTVQAGRTLGAISGDFASGVKVKFAGLTGAFATAWMHQDSTYAYQAAGSEWTITHGSTNGLGSMVINTTAAPIELKPAGTSATPPKMFDSLQAAVDETKAQAVGSEDVITVGAGYTGNGVISVAGEARTFKVNVAGNTTISSNASGDVVKVSNVGRDWTVQLLKDTVSTGDVTITVTENTFGTTTLSASKAREGDTVTVTVQPNQGNSVTSVTARTNNGDNVVVTASATNANQYTFVVPKGATSIVVTPVFKQGVTQAVVNVSASSQGSVTTTASATENKVNTGSTVGVTTYPGPGYRTIGVNITTNGGATTANRTGDNNFTFVVPANATTVTVTPVYDRDNGTKFTDVLSSEYYSNAVSWAVSKGITTGQSTYLFGSNNYCNRSEMVTFLYRAAGQPPVGNVRNPFVDVNPGDYYYNAVLWAVSKGITDGIDATHFGPKQYVTRAQAVTFLYRYENSPAASTSNAFYDVSASDYFAKAVTWAANKGVTNGKTTTSFAPKDACRRCEIVTFLYRDVTGTRA